MASLTKIVHQARNIPEGANAIRGAVEVKEISVAATELDHVGDTAVELAVGVDIL